jgi:GTP-binding protein
VKTRGDDMCKRNERENNLTFVLLEMMKARIIPPIIFSLEEVEIHSKDEYVEVTPKSIRLRKFI